MLLMLHGAIGVGHASLGVSVVAHSVGWSTVSAVLLGVVLVLILVIGVCVSATVSTAPALVLVTTRRGMVRIALVTLVIVMRATVTLALSHHLRVSETTLNGTTKLLRMSGISIIVTNSLLLVSTHSIKLVLGGSVMGSVL